MSDAPPERFFTRLEDGRVQVDAVGINRWRVETNLRRHGVSEAIIERVLRLNPDPKEGYLLRGLNYSDDSYWWISRGLVPIGQIYRRYGRAFVETIPADKITKRGRRRYVHRGWSTPR